MFMRAQVFEHEDRYETFNKLVRNFEYSNFENCKKLSVLAQILSFLQKIRVFPHKTFEQSKCRTYPSFFWTSDSMMRCSCRTMGVVEPNLLSLLDFLNFKKDVLNFKKSVTKADVI